MTFEYNNVTETKLEEFVAKFRKRAMNTQNSCDSGEPGDVHSSNGFMQSCETCHTFTI